MKPRRIIVFLAAALALFLLAALLAPRFIDLSHTRDQIAAQLSQRLHGEVHIDALRLVILPLPHLVAEGVSATVPDVGTARIRSVSLHAKLRALLTGKLQLGKIGLDRPDVAVRIREGPAGTVPPLSNLTGLRQQIRSGLAAVESAAASQAPGLVLAARGGNVRVTLNDGRELTFGDIKLRLHLPPDRLRAELVCGSSLWEHLALDASIDPATLAGDAALDVTHLKPDALLGGLAPAGVHLGPSETSFALHLTAEADGHVKADADGSAPALRLHRGDRDVLVRIDHLHAEAKSDGDTTRIVATDWRFAEPRMNLSGEIVLEGTADPLRARPTDPSRMAAPSGPPLARGDYRGVPPTAGSGAQNDPTWVGAETATSPHPSTVLKREAPQASVKIEGDDVDVPSVRRAAMALAPDTRTVREIFDVLRGGMVSSSAMQVSGPSLAHLDWKDSLTVHGHLAGGEVRVPGVHLDLHDVSGDASVASGVLTGEHTAARLNNSRASDGQFRVGLRGEDRELHVETAVRADGADLPPLLKQLASNPVLSRQLDRLSSVKGTIDGTLVLGGTTKQVTASVDASTFDVTGRMEDLSQPFRLRGGRFDYRPGSFAASRLVIETGRSTLSQLTAHIDWSHEEAAFEASAGTSRIELGEIYPFLGASGWLPASPYTPHSMNGLLAIRSAHIAGPANEPGAWRFDLDGAAERLDVESPLLRRHVAIRPPVSLAGLRIARDDSGAVSFSGKFASPGALGGAVDLAWNGDRLDVKRFAIRDERSDASLSLMIQPNLYDVAFKGALFKETVDALIPDNDLLGGSVEGDFRTHVTAGTPAQVSAEGRLKVTDVSLPITSAVSLRIASLSLDGKGGALGVDAALDVGKSSHVHASGSVRPVAQGIAVDFDADSDEIDWSDLQPLLSRDRGGAPESAGSGNDVPVSGRIRLSCKEFKYDRWTWAPLRAAVALAPNRTTVRISAANLCGVDTRGTIVVTPAGVEVNLNPVATHQPVDEALRCLGAPDGVATGRYDLSGTIRARGEPAEIARAASGHLELRATDGRIYRIETTAKILSVVNVATGAFDDIGGLRKEGLPYKTIVMKGDLRGGALVLTEAFLDGPTVRIAGKGSIDVVGKTVDLTLLVAPLKTVATIVGNIPLVKRLPVGGLISIPVRVTGDLSDPSVIPLDPSAVGSEVVGLMTRTLKLPLKLLAPVLPGGEKK